MTAPTVTTAAGRLVLPVEQRHISALLAHQRRQRPDRPYLTIEGRTHTFAETHDQVLRVAAGLAGLGVGEGSRVAVMLPNVAAFAFLWFAAAHLGATLVAINPQFRGKLLENALGAAFGHASDGAAGSTAAGSGGAVLVLHAASADALASVPASIRSRISAVVGADAATANRNGAASLPAWLAAPPAAASAARGDWRSIQVISFTSGSTGPAKGVLITTNQALDAACTYIHATALTADDTLYTPFAFFHGMSTRLGLLPALIVGAHVAVAEKFSASRYWRDAIACGATVGQTLPPMTAMLKAMPAAAHDTAHRITRMYNSRADEDFEGRFGVRLVEAYGMTEIGLPIYCPFPERRAGAAGKVHPDWELAIVDECDQPVAAGEPGELVFRPRLPGLLTPGYVGRPDATVEATRNLWFHSGDIGRRDADGYVYFIDRRKERIRRLGENISSFDVESLVSAHPDVRECAALAHPAALGEDDLRIVVVAAQDVTLDAGALYDWLVGVMPKYMLPRYIEIVPSLPRTPTNKVEKYLLKDAGLGVGAWDRDVQRPTPRTSRIGVQPS